MRDLRRDPPHGRVPGGLSEVSSFPAERVRKAPTKPPRHLERREIFAASCEPPQGQSSDIVSRSWLSIEAIEQSADLRHGSFATGSSKPRSSHVRRPWVRPYHIGKCDPRRMSLPLRMHISA